MKEKIKVAVAMSGGVDSAVAAALLKEQGYEVIGVYMKNWSNPSDCGPDPNRRDALRVALKLKIPFKVFDFEKQYRAEVIEYFFDSYARGLTPNPDVMCNRQIKFGSFLEKAVGELGVDFIATGHYARIARKFKVQSSKFKIDEREEVYHLLKGVDKNKDQSYFLWTLTQEQLSRTLFPVGEMTKREVRQKAAELGLPVASKPDSQGICFVGEINVHEFLKERLGEKSGEIVDVDGRVWGKHPGAHFFTVGQRHGLGVGGGIPYYVVGTDIVQNRVVVAPRNHPAHFKETMVVADVNWVSGQAPKFPRRCGVKIRYRQPDVGAVVQSAASGLHGASLGEPPANRILRSSPLRSSPADRSAAVVVKFAEPQRAVTPGQSAVFYVGEELWGGGVIEGQRPLKALRSAGGVVCE